MSRLQRFAATILLPVLTLTLGWGLGIRYEHQRSEAARVRLESISKTMAGSGSTIRDPQKQVDISLLWSVWRILLEEYVQPTDMKPQQMVYGAVRGMVNALGDPYTVFMTPKENEDFHQVLSGQLQGIGAELALRQERIVIVAPLKGSPAEKAGLLPEDTIVAINGVSAEGKSLEEVVGLIRGKKGTQVTLTIARASAPQPLSFTITRDDILVPSVESDVKVLPKGQIGLLTINQFGDGTIAEVTKVLEGFKRKPLTAIIIDLRFNGGGYLDGAVDLTSMFLRKGTIVTVQGRGDSRQEHYVSGRTIYPDLPLAVLINQGTASASEIVAGALQDHKRALIIGTKSFGKGTVQEVLDLPGGSSLRVTTAHWLTPSGKNLGKEGVTPDITVERTQKDIETKKDPQMDAAIDLFLKK